VAKQVQASFWDDPIEDPRKTVPMGRMFEFLGYHVRVELINEEPWWVLSDVAKVLGYRDASNASRVVKDHQRGTHKVSTPSGDQSAIVVSEAGLYRLIMKSQSPVAAQFQDWVEEIVLPSIRKKGSYKVGDRVGAQEKKLKCDKPTAETRVLSIDGNKQLSGLAHFCGAKGSRDYGRLHNICYEIQFSKDAKALKSELEKKDTPLNHMGILPLSVNHISKAVLVQRAKEAHEAGVKLSVDQLSTGLAKVTKEINQSVLDQLGPGHSWQIVEDPSRGKIIDATKQLTG
jgi:prophage antirepressor-like protein